MAKNQEKDMNDELSYKAVANKSIGLLVGVGVAALIVGGIGGFFTGYVAGKAGSNQLNPGMNGQNGMNQSANGGGFGGRFGRGGFGTVSAVSASSITVKNLRQGNDTVYTITSNTAVTNGDATASVSDIKVGDRVIVGSDDGGASDSSTKTATTIQINPTMRRSANQ